jgi:hypothetical protein
MARQHHPADLTPQSTNPVSQQSPAQGANPEQPLHRRRALQLLGALAAAAGAAALTAGHPEQASAANPPLLGISTSSTPGCV